VPTGFAAPELTARHFVANQMAVFRSNEAPATIVVSVASATDATGKSTVAGGTFDPRALNSSDRELERLRRDRVKGQENT
jgi:hypothetical protein